MEWFYAVLLGAVQGITEFLPISSSGHLWLAEQLIVKQPPSLPLIATLHLASLLTVIWVLRKKLGILIKSLFISKNNDPFYNRRLAWQLLLATIITGVVGLTLKHFIEQEMNQTILLVSLIITSLIIFGSALGKPQKAIPYCSWLMIVLLGCIQGFAAFPGISRSGVTIGFLLLWGLSKERTVDVSFLLSIPAILGAFLIFLPQLSFNTLGMAGSTSLSSASIMLLISGLVTAVFSYIMIHLLRKRLDKVWILSGIWCLLVASGLMLF